MTLEALAQRVIAPGGDHHWIAGQVSQIMVFAFGPGAEVDLQHGPRRPETIGEFPYFVNGIEAAVRLVNAGRAPIQVVWLP